MSAKAYIVHDPPVRNPTVMLLQYKKYKEPFLNL